jgi:hypothetical protein
MNRMKCINTETYLVFILKIIDEILSVYLVNCMIYEQSYCHARNCMEIYLYGNIREINYDIYLYTENTLVLKEYIPFSQWQ